MIAQASLPLGVAPYGEQMDENWENLQRISRRLSEDFPDAVFIGGVAVSAHARILGERFQESSHDIDLYLSLQGKSAMRDLYEMSRNEKLGKHSALIEGEDVDIYVERQHPLGVPYDAVFSGSQMVGGIRAAALEHLLVLKLDAARNRWGTGKGEKDVRDLTRIVALLDRPAPELLAPYLGAERVETLDRLMKREDLPKILGLNVHEGSKFRLGLDRNTKGIKACCRPPEGPGPAPPPGPADPNPRKPKKG